MMAARDDKKTPDAGKPPTLPYDWAAKPPTPDTNAAVEAILAAKSRGNQ